VLTGRKTGEAGETFMFGKGLYADDAGLLFETRADLELGARLLKQHLTRFGLMMHCGEMSPDGAVANKSKTEAVFYPPAGHTPTPNDTLPLQIDNALGIVTFTQQFRYLGAISSSTLSDADEIAQRLRSAAPAFGCLRKGVFGQSFGSSSLPLASKGKLYSTLVLNLLPTDARMGADSAAPPTAEHVPQPLRTCDGTASTHLPLRHQSPHSFRQAPCSRADVRRHRPHEPRPGHLQSEAALGRARETHGLVEAPSQGPHVVGRRTS
jgi:hypothetical protein